MVDYIWMGSVTYFEELLDGLYDANPDEDLHLMLNTLGGDGEVAVRMARSAQDRCRQLTVIVPDRAKSAGTLLAMGAHSILMGPTSDLGPVDPQLNISQETLNWVAAKDLIAAVDGALQQVQNQPNAVPLMASLLSDVTYLMYQQAQSAIQRADDLMKEALASNPDRLPEQIEELTEKLKKPFIADPKVHGAMFGAKEAIEAGLPVQQPKPSETQWQMIWRLWTKYFRLIKNGCSIYESRTASQVLPF
ncbi:MAG: serine dehydrogenase [bacterium]|nr:serine dehydrogenase [bacterium]